LGRDLSRVPGPLFKITEIDRENNFKHICELLALTKKLLLVVWTYFFGIDIGRYSTGRERMSGMAPHPKE
jgi:hypothetical protein